jgi:uncharacterized protein (DUF2235 family)
MAKSMIFLFDGTANNATSATFSNVYAINQLISEHRMLEVEGNWKHITQISFYLPGVGTNFTVKEPDVKSKWGLRSIGQVLFGDGLEQLILRAYVNLCANYRCGDDIILIGFSRGAAAARIFSRMISDFGILRSKTLMYLDRLWSGFIKISREPNDVEYFNKIETLKADFSRSYSDGPVFHNGHEVKIKFLGTFDTVVGPYDGSLSSNLEFRDEYPASAVENVVHLMSMHDVREIFELKRFNPRIGQETNIREIWMPGVHSDVGGGYVENFLSNISLLTMAEFMRQYGDVALDQVVYNDTVANIRSKIASDLLTVNREQIIGPSSSRQDDINQYDQIHPIHYYLKDRMIFWKGGSDRIKYQDKYKINIGKTDKKLVDLLSQWTAVPQNVIMQQS